MMTTPGYVYTHTGFNSLPTPQQFQPFKTQWLLHVPLALTAKISSLSPLSLFTDFVLFQK